MTAPSCPRPTTCPVPGPGAVNRTRLRTVALPAGTALVMAAREAHWPSLFNASGAGRGRFSPVDVDGALVPTAYFATTATVALLETALQDVAAARGSLVDRVEALAPWLVARVSAPRDLRLVDLRDEALDRLGLARAQLVSTDAEYYRCTREWAVALHGQVVGGQPTHGLMWHSRVAELGGAASAVLGDVGSEVCVLFGDSLPTDATAWAAEVRYEDLGSGPGLTHVEDVVTLLGGTII